MKFTFLVASAFLFLSGCNGQIISHDEKVAANLAEQFGKQAFVGKDFASVYQQLTEGVRKANDEGKIAGIIQKLHEDGYPQAIRATEYEPMPGQRAVTIFLSGENGEQKFYYRLVMEGSASEGYRVGGFWKGSGPYPESKLRQKLQG